MRSVSLVWVWRCPPRVCWGRGRRGLQGRGAHGLRGGCGSCGGEILLRGPTCGPGRRWVPSRLLTRSWDSRLGRRCGLSYSPLRCFWRLRGGLQHSCRSSRFCGGWRSSGKLRVRRPTCDRSQVWMWKCHFGEPWRKGCRRRQGCGALPLCSGFCSDGDFQVRRLRRDAGQWRQRSLSLGWWWDRPLALGGGLSDTLVEWLMGALRGLHRLG